MDIRHPLDTRLPEMLRSGRPLRGIFNSLPSAAVVEMCGYAGFDFVLIDNEHGSAGHETTENMLRAARASGIVPVVRCLRQDMARVLDMGASAVQVPMVESAAEARDLVQQVRYPGGGRRGSAFSSRAAGYGAFPGAAHTQRSNQGIALIVMIETPEAVEQAAEIAAVEGVDAVFVGPNDLSHSMGFGSDWKSPVVEAAIERAACDLWSRQLRRNSRADAGRRSQVRSVGGALFCDRCVERDHPSVATGIERRRACWASRRHHILNKLHGLLGLPGRSTRTFSAGR
ncbi:MAG: aldolase/citrate lyase family protein [Variovorax sp.]